MQDVQLLPALCSSAWLQGSCLVTRSSLELCLPGSISGDNFDAPFIPHDLLRPLQSTAPSGVWLFPDPDLWGDKVWICQLLHAACCSACAVAAAAVKVFSRDLQARFMMWSAALHTLPALSPEVLASFSVTCAGAGTGTGTDHELRVVSDSSAGLDCRCWWRQIASSTGPRMPCACCRTCTSHSR